MTALIDMIRLLDQSRFEPMVLCHAPTAFDDELRDMGVKVRVLSSDAGKAARHHERSYALAPMRNWRLLNAATRMVRTELPLARRIEVALREGAVDLVHQNDHPRADRASIIAARMSRLPQVCHVRYLAPRYSALDRILARGVGYYIFVSHDIERRFRQAVKVPAEKGRTIHEAVDVQKYLALDDSVVGQVRAELCLRPHERMVVNAGRLVPWKGHDVFLEALAVVVRKRPNVRGVIVGSPPANERGAQWLQTLQDRAAALGLTDHVRFTGFRSDVHRLIGAADVVVHSATRPEPFGRVVVESMAAARPVIATRAGGILDIVRDGETGLLVEPGDAIEMASAISQLLNDPGGARRLGDRARTAVVKGFPPERFAEAVMKLYEEVVRNHGVRNAERVP